MTYDDSAAGPSVHPGEGRMPSVCPNCEIPIYPGTDHTVDEGCFIALKQFVKLCQDDIENSRMKDFQHPTREELVASVKELADRFEQLADFCDALSLGLRKLLHGTMVHG